MRECSKERESDPWVPYPVHSGLKPNFLLSFKNEDSDQLEHSGASTSSPLRTWSPGEVERLEISARAEQRHRLHVLY